MRKLRAMLRALSLNCHDSSSLVSDGLDRELESDEQLALRMHMLTCTGCKRMRKQLTLMHNAHSAFGSRAVHTKAELSEQARQRINDRLASES